MRLKARKDSNHAEIVTEFRKFGWFVTDVASIPKICDIRIDRLIDQTAISVVVEIKDGAKPVSSRKLTQDEVNYLNDCPGHIAIIESLQDVLDLTSMAFDIAQPNVVHLQPIRYKFDEVLKRGVK